MSALSGMTGFARVSGSIGESHWTWEARSVNGKGLDVRLRMPSDLSGLDGPIRKAFASRFKRGNIQVSLDLKDTNTGALYRINSEFAQALMDYAVANQAALSIGDLLQVPGVVTEQTATRTPEEQAVLEAELFVSAQKLVTQLGQARDAEGQAIAPLLNAAIDQVEALIAEAETLSDIRPEQIRVNIKAKLSELLADDIPEDRIAQEAAVLAMKADIREELDRLRAHCNQAREHLALGSPIGRKLDFLCQEFNRETNTLCSKSSTIALTRIGLELKSVIEQFREQAANAE